MYHKDLKGLQKTFWGTTKILKAFIKPFEGPQRSVKNISVNFYFNTSLWNVQGGKD